MGINNQERYADIVVYPNPTKGIINADITLTSTSPLEVSVYNPLGQLVAEQSRSNFNSGIISFDFKNQPKGIYLVKVVANDQVKVQRVILE